MQEDLLNQISITADSTTRIDGGLLLSGPSVTLELQAAPVRYLYSGWQSWSLTAWLKTDHPVHTPRPSILHPMQVDPVHVRDRCPNGSWYGAVELPSGKIIFLGALNLDTHVALSGNDLQGWQETRADGSAPIHWFAAAGDEAEIFQRYSELLGDRLGRGRAASPFKVWCSWYSLYTEIHEEQLLKILADLGDLPFDVFQVDDGWQAGIGNWEANKKFPSGMAALAERIKATGRRAGVWLAPLLITPSSPVYREHPDWLLHRDNGLLVSAGFNWGEPLYALDTTHPGSLEWLAGLMQKVRSWGYDYAKLDFLYAGALPGKRHADMPREAAYRQGLKVIREALGEAYLLTCGAPILPSIGLCDAMRVGPDVGGHYASHRDDMLLMNFAAPGVRNALRTTLHRVWLRPLLHTDPDVVYFRTVLNDLSSSQKSILQDLAVVCNFKATSDVPAWLTPAELAALRNFLGTSPAVTRLGPQTYSIEDRRVDFAPFIDMPAPPGPVTNLQGAIISGLANIILLEKLFDLSGRIALRRALRNHPV